MMRLIEKANEVARSLGYDKAQFITILNGRKIFASVFEPVDGEILLTGIPRMLIQDGERVVPCDERKNFHLFSRANAFANTMRKFKKV